MLLTETQSDFSVRTIRLGVATLGAGIVANFIPVIYIWFDYGIIPPLTDLLKIWAVAAAAFGTAWVVQPISYFPVLGVSGSYVSWLVGSVADIRLPASTMAQKVTGVEHGSPEGEVISTMAIAVSVLVSVSIISLFTFIGAAVVPLLPKFIQKSFNYILPAVFGAVFVELSMKHAKVGMVTLIYAAIFTLIAPSMNIPGWLLSILIIAGAILIARVFYKMETRRT